MGTARPILILFLFSFIFMRLQAISQLLILHIVVTPGSAPAYALPTWVAVSPWDSPGHIDEDSITMSQVKNLRAMFENKEDTSPPDRGRTSGVSTPNQSGPHGTGSPRPLSKVRTSFVAIEKDGRMGLRRDPSGESNVSRRRMSNETDVESIATIPDKSAMASTDEAVKPARKLFVTEPIPESPLQPSISNDISHTAITSSSARELATTEPSGGQQPADPEANVIASINTSVSPTKSAPAHGSQTNTINTKDVPISSAPSKKSNQQQDAPSGTPANKKDTTRSSTTSKTTLGNARKPDVKPTSNPPAKSPNNQNSRSNLKEPFPATKSSAVGARKPQILKTKASHDAGFSKPKTKSPTKPASLPSSLTAPTASSVSKGSAPRQSLSRQSGTLQNQTATGRSPSRASVSTTGAPSKTIRRQASTISRSRPSLGPPPKKATQPESSTKKPQSQVDEGFLARMMRPTQSSSSKVAEKAPVTPPRKAPQRPNPSSSRPSAAHAGKAKQGEDGETQTKPLVVELPTKSAIDPVKEAQPLVDAEGTDPNPSNATNYDQTQQAIASKETADVSSVTTTDPDDGGAVTQMAAVETVDEVAKLAHELDKKLSLTEPVTIEQNDNTSPTRLSAGAVEGVIGSPVVTEQSQSTSGVAQANEDKMDVEDKPAPASEGEGSEPDSQSEVPLSAVQMTSGEATESAKDQV
ncbi:hypothetical protein HJFPF1_01373 [Paramyrothecium foliicola]|nr:hypothetical protein HJFPF1_01373 [Paramyrothecium foliicola]